MRINDHPILGPLPKAKTVTILVDGKELVAREDEPILSTLLSYGITTQNISPKIESHRGLFCGIGRCTSCVMTVNGMPNVRTCVTKVEEGMVIKTQLGLGDWSEHK